MSASARALLGLRLSEARLNDKRRRAHTRMTTGDDETRRRRRANSISVASLVSPHVSPNSNSKLIKRASGTRIRSNHQKLFAAQFDTGEERPIRVRLRQASFGAQI